jgi:hypothetical protein
MNVPRVNRVNEPRFWVQLDWRHWRAETAENDQTVSGACGSLLCGQGRLCYSP